MACASVCSHPGDNINALALLHDTPSDVSIVATSPDGCVVAVLERNELQQSLGDAEAILNRCLALYYVYLEAFPVHFVCTGAATDVFHKFSVKQKVLTF